VISTDNDAVIMPPQIALGKRLGRFFDSLNATPNCEGLKILVESSNRGYSDYINGNGRAWGYRVTILENGDKIFSEYFGNSHTTVTADGSKKAPTAVFTL
jgi:hypothetical protein